MRSVEAMGGEAAIGAVETRVSKSRVEMPAYGLKGTVTTYQSRPNNFLFNIDFGSASSATRGYDGETLWELDSRTGPRIYEGAEKATLVLVYHLDRSNYAQLFESLETVGIEEVEGEACYKVVATPKSNAKPITTYYSTESWLPLRMDFVLENQRTATVFKNYYKDYRKIGDVLFPHSAVQNAGGVVSTTTYESIELNVEIDPKRFEVPDEIKALK